MKNKMLKRILSIALVCCMAFAMSTTALAARGDSGGSTDTPGSNPSNPDTPSNPSTPAEPGATKVEKSLDYTASLEAPTIEVELTSNGAIIMNPYGLTFTDPVSENDSASSIATAVNIITSKTLAPLDVDVTITSSAPEGVTWADATTDASEDKEVFLQFALQAVASDDISTPTWAGAGGISGGTWTATTAMTTKSNLASAKAALITLNGTTQAEGEDANYFVMPAAADADNPVYAAFKLCGDLATKAETPWTAADTVTASVAFTFNIMSNAQLS